MARSAGSGWTKAKWISLQRTAKEKTKSLSSSPMGNGRSLNLKNCAGPFMGQWGFTDGGRAVAIESSGHHGPNLYIKYQISTGKATDHIDQYVAYDRLPAWAKQVSEERADK